MAKPKTVEVWDELCAKEYKSKATELVDLNCYLDDMNQKKKDLSDALNPSIKATKENIHDISRELKTNKKLRKVEVDYKKNLDEKVMMCIRLEDKKRLSKFERPLEEHEMQEEMDL